MHSVKKKFIDTRTISIVSGSGGSGCVSFLREKFIDRGPPNGGDGGPGGDVYIQPVSSETSLLRVPLHVKAGRGSNGMGSSRHGHKGKDAVIQVPIGTVVKEVSRDTTKSIQLSYIHYPAYQSKNETMDEFKSLPATEYNSQAFAEPIFLDLHSPSQPILLLSGGRGGKGNIHYQTPTMRVPRYAMAGRAGITARIHLELKLLADIGLVGLPNAGKSTLLRAISNAKPRVGHWAFTTLSPNIGTITYGNEAKQFTVADIPGLVAGSQDKKGLGLDFLRHTERAGALAYVLDLSRPEPWNDLDTLFQEIRAYGGIEGKPYIVFANKADLPGTEEKFNQLQLNGVNAVPISAMSCAGVDTVINKMAEMLNRDHL